jgi:hypothetical protein
MKAEIQLDWIKIDIRNAKAFQADCNDAKGKAENGIKGVSYPSSKKEFIDTIKRFIKPEASSKIIIEHSGKKVAFLSEKDLTRKGQALFEGLTYSNVKNYKKDKISKISGLKWINDAACLKFK